MASGSQAATPMLEVVGAGVGHVYIARAVTIDF
jgi:hypothetical protein